MDKFQVEIVRMVFIVVLLLISLFFTSCQIKDSHIAEAIKLGNSPLEVKCAFSSGCPHLKEQ